MMRLMKFLVLALLALSWPGLAQAAEPTVGKGLAGEVLASRFEAPALGRPWDYEIYLPPGYSETSGRYPVIYLLHGYNDVPISWIAKAQIDLLADRMIADRQMRPVILVMPAAGRSWYIDGPEKMESAFMDDLVPEIDRRYRTQPDRAGRMVAGLSMGGYGTMRLGLRYPDRFSAMALLSPAVYLPEPPATSGARVAPVFQTDGQFDPKRWRDMNYPGLLDGFAHAGYPLRVQLSAGLQDQLGCQLAAEQFAQALHAEGLPAEIHLLPGAHDFILWRQTLPMALHFLAPVPGDGASPDPAQVAQAVH